MIQKYRVNRADPGTLSASYTCLHPDLNPASLTLDKGPGGTYLCAWGRVAGKTVDCLKTGGQTAGTVYSDSRGVPRSALINKTRTGHGAYVTAYAAFNPGGCKYFHN